MDPIVEIVEVRDTREYAECGNDEWVPVPGTGELHDCARCNRTHEVHATVRLASGQTAIVGTGCMGSKSLNVEARRAAGTAATVARLRARLAALKGRQELWMDADCTVLSLPRPEVAFRVTQEPAGTLLSATLSDPALPGLVRAERYLRFEPDSPALRAELAKAAARTWTSKRRAMICGDFGRDPIWYLDEQIAEIGRRLAAAEKRVIRAAA